MVFSGPTASQATVSAPWAGLRKMLRVILKNVGMARRTAGVSTHTDA